MKEGIYSIEEIKAIVAPIARRHGVERLFLFGSYARGEATADSDIDLCVKAPALRGLFALGGLYADFEEALGKKLDMVTESALKNTANAKFSQNLQKDRVLLYELIQ